ncbi:hypothetical protein HPB50_022307 [Hyalomma asiaticum]|uniref:Uncharacterized protein n=1 Tax=Hyalomma asiaticum TaxID=266040 RepID=A0ACB7SRW2_HYAAI|nr:hypothetical protein HPB50_022307 [Hyalomma asiaticum]
MYSGKAWDVMHKCFEEVKLNPQELKKRALELLTKYELDKLASVVKKEKGQTLEVFFAEKTHKQEVPFRATVSEHNSWQFHVSGFLQKILASLSTNDPFVIKNSEEVGSYVAGLKEGSYKAFSVDIQDSYYSLPQDALLQSYVASSLGRGRQTHQNRLWQCPPAEACQPGPPPPPYFSGTPAPAPARLELPRLCSFHLRYV